MSHQSRRRISSSDDQKVNTKKVSAARISSAAAKKRMVMNGGHPHHTASSPSSSLSVQLRDFVIHYKDRVLPLIVEEVERILQCASRCRYFPTTTTATTKTVVSSVVKGGMTEQPLVVLSRAQQRNHVFMHEVERMLESSVMQGYSIESSTARLAYDVWADCNVLNAQLEEVLQSEASARRVPRTPLTTTRLSPSPHDVYHHHTGGHVSKSNEEEEENDNCTTSQGEEEITKSNNSTERGKAHPQHQSLPSSSNVRKGDDKQNGRTYSAAINRNGRGVDHYEKSVLLEALTHKATHASVSMEEVALVQELFDSIHGGTSSGQLLFLEWLSHLPIEQLQQVQKQLSE